MIARSLFLALATTLVVAAPSVQDTAKGFELFPRPKSQYTVQRGDTLYGVAGYYYTNPSLWPFLWNQNPQIKIKDRGGAPENQPLAPGSLVNLYQSRTSAPFVNERYEKPNGLPDDLRFFITDVPLQGIPYDKKYFRYKLSLRPTKMWGYIVSSPEVTREHFLVRDLVYLRFRPSKKQAILVGDRFGVYREKGPLNHPLNPERPIGYFNDIIGEIEITSTGNEMATAIILDGYEEISRGDKVCLFTPRRREIVPTKTHRMLTGTILMSASRSDTFFQDNNNLENDIVFVDRGECDGMQEGQLVNIYRVTDPVDDPFFHRPVSVPDRYVGEGMILKAFDKNATILITKSLEEIKPGDVIRSVSD
jgi:hypothetical protein